MRGCEREGGFRSGLSSAVEGLEAVSSLPLCMMDPNRGDGQGWVDLLVYITFVHTFRCNCVR